MHKSNVARGSRRVHLKLSGRKQTHSLTQGCGA
jgi:hypothetical protein